MSLFGNLSEKLAMSVLANLRVGNIIDHGNEVFIERFNNVVIRENGRTARDTIVSDTAQRVAVHRPNEDRFARFGGFDSSIPKIVPPINFPPFFFAREFSQPIKNGSVVVEIYAFSSNGPQISSADAGFSRGSTLGLLISRAAS